MSTSIASSDPTMRRRPVVLEKRPNIELLAGDAGVSPVNEASANTATKLSCTRKVVSKPKRPNIELLVDDAGFSPVNEASANTATKFSCTRKVVSKPKRPRWLTLVSIFSKNLVLLIVILGLVQMIRKLALKSTDSSGGSLVVVPYFVRRIDEVEGSLVVVPDFVRRIDEVESFMKTMMTMMQVQVDAVDKKIESEVGGLRRELSDKIEEKAGEVNHRFEKLDSKSEILEKKLGELGAVEFYRKEDRDKILDDLMNVKGADNGDMEVSLDDIIMTARDTLMKEIHRLGRVDYALSSGGAKVVRHSEPFIIGKVGRWFRKISLTTVYRDSEKMLKPSFGEPGQCFPLKGDSGFVQIRLRTTIILQAITLEHVDKAVAYDRSSAPKNCRVYGWHQGYDAGKMFLLAEFSYDLEKSNAQTFNVLDSVGSGLVDTVRLDFTSNHGSPSHTCIYRLQVHGHEPTSVSMLATQS